MAAIANIVLTIFSPSPTHFEVSVDADMLKKVDLDWAAMAFPSRVLPVPGGPKNITPRGGALIPLKMSGLSIGQMMISWMVFFANSRPAMSSHSIVSYLSIISFSISSTMRGSKFLYLSSVIHSGKSSLFLSSFSFSSSLPMPLIICYWTDLPGWKPPDWPPEPGPYPSPPFVGGTNLRLPPIPG